MLITLLRLYLGLVPSEATHELAHRACEIVVYAWLAPDAQDDAIDPSAEPVAELACRNWW